MSQGLDETLAVPVDQQPTMVSAGQRVVAIDLVRAFTMVLMIFVNDLWSLQDVPAWLGHVDAGVDGIGLADVVFPAFLFIVGLSLPFAIDQRRVKGASDRELVNHVMYRSFALLVMGVFLVNGETLNAAATGMPRYIWNPVCCVCFILIWNSYPAHLNRVLVQVLRFLAIGTLIVFAWVYRGGPDDSLEYFSPQWWGILGLIGWSYLMSGLTTIFARNNFVAIALAWLFFSVLSMVSHAGLLPEFVGVIPSAISGGTLTALVLGGVLVALIFQHYRRRGVRKLTMVLLAFSAVLVVLSVITRPYWGLAKLGATPAWLFLCSAFSIWAFLIMHYLADVRGKEHWFRWIKPAGTATLLCYLVPYFAYATTRLLGIELPAFILVGGVGLLKSFAFALMCVAVTGLMIRAGLRFRV